jgi:hypothetical protein
MNELLDSVHKMRSSQITSVQTLHQAESKLNSVDETTRQTQEALVRLAKDAEKRKSEGATVKDVHTIMQTLQNVETMIQNQLLQDHIHHSRQSNSNSTLHVTPELPPTNLESRNEMGCTQNVASTTGFEHEAEHCSSDNPITQFLRVNQLVDIAITVRYRQGKPIIGVIGILDPDFEAAEFETKVRMVKFLQDLRLLFWLFAHNNNFERSIQRQTTNDQSAITKSSNLAITWNLWKTSEVVRAGCFIPNSTRNRHDKCYMNFRTITRHLDQLLPQQKAASQNTSSINELPPSVIEERLAIYYLAMRVVSSAAKYAFHGASQLE